MNNFFINNILCGLVAKIIHIIQISFFYKND